MVAFLNCPGPKSFITNSNTKLQQNICSGSDITLCPYCYANLFNSPIETHEQCENPSCNCCFKKSFSSPIVDAAYCGCCKNQLVGENKYVPAEYCRCPWCTEEIKIYVGNDGNEVHSGYHPTITKEIPQCENHSCNCCFKNPRINPVRNCESCNIESGKNYFPFEYYCCPWCSGGLLINRYQEKGIKNHPENNGNRNISCPHCSGEPYGVRTNANNIALSKKVKQCVMKCTCCKRCENNAAMPCEIHPENNGNRIISCPYCSGEPYGVRTNANNIALSKKVKQCVMKCTCCKRCEDDAAMPCEIQYQSANQDMPANNECKPTRSTIIVGGKLITNPVCAKRNGLQDECGCNYNIY